MTTRSNKRSSSSSNQESSNFSNAFGMFSKGFETLMKAQHKNAQTLAAAQNEALKTAKVLAEDHNAFIQQRVNKANDFFLSLNSSGLDVREKFQTQSQAMQESVTDFLHHTQHLSQILNTARERITSLVQGRMQETVEEVQTTFHKR